VLVVIALGGNALARRGEPLEAELQRVRVKCAAAAVAEVAAAHAVVVTHGNGPQVGLLALQSEAYAGVGAYPLDVLGAESEGMIGYLIEQELSSCLPGHEIATLLTQVEVDPDDPAFSTPSKPIGPLYPEQRARSLAAQRGWAIAPDASGFRRVVASPEPRRILELRTIRLLVDANVIVVCAGGGGIPVLVSAGGSVRGVEAVVDKDRSAALLAAQLGAQVLLLLTDVPAVWADWPEPAERAIRSATPPQMEALSFDPGSMGPKVEAACHFVARTGGRAGIGALQDALRILQSEAGTTIRSSSEPMELYAPGVSAQLRGSA
jgi:carbamate kinase